MCGGLHQLGFDGWGEDFNQFVEWRSADIYPIAWCELVRHPLQAPKENGHVHQTGPDSKKRFETWFLARILMEHKDQSCGLDSPLHFESICFIRIIHSFQILKHFLT